MKLHSQILDSQLALSAYLLSVRDFSAARKCALSGRHSFPTLPHFPQILAVADVLLSAAAANTPDWYSVLQLKTLAHNNTLTISQIRTQFKKLLFLLNPTKNPFPFSREAFELVCNAWSVLSDPQNRTRYDNGIIKNGGGIRTFWTVCPYCYYLYEFERTYEGCCLRCRNCKRGFHGVAVAPPLEGMVVEGKEEYYCVFGCFPLRYDLGCSLDDKKQKSAGGDGDLLGGTEVKDGGFRNCFVNPVEISDDSDNDGEIGEKGNGDKIGGNYGLGSEEEEAVKKETDGVETNLGNIDETGPVMHGNGRNAVHNGGVRVAMMKKNVKSVPRNTKKLMGRGKKIRKLNSMGDFETKRLDTKAEVVERAGTIGATNGNGDEFSDGELDFFVGEDDIYVGLKYLD